MKLFNNNDVTDESFTLVPWLLDKEHLVNRHLVNRHLVDRHLVDRHLVNRHLVDRHLVNRHLVNRHLVNRHLVDWHLVNRHLVDRHLVDKHSLKRDLSSMSVGQNVFAQKTQNLFLAIFFVENSPETCHRKCHHGKERLNIFQVRYPPVRQKALPLLLLCCAALLGLSSQARMSSNNNSSNKTRNFNWRKCYDKKTKTFLKV